jgi:RNA polymerase sigma factor (sigma-70 family)
MDQRARTDWELLSAARRHPEAFGDLYDRYAEPVYRWARRAGLPEPDAYDVVGEVFARAWVARSRFRDPGDGSAGPWLFGIARNLVASYRRSGKIEARARDRLHIERIDEPDASDAISERLDATAARPELELAMSALPGVHRDAVRLRVLEGLAYPDIAVRLGCTETTARKWVSLGLRSLRGRLEATP